jgi:hypothetical protein
MPPVRCKVVDCDQQARGIVHVSLPSVDHPHVRFRLCDKHLNELKDVVMVPDHMPRPAITVEHITRPSHPPPSLRARDVDEDE